MQRMNKGPEGACDTPGAGNRIDSTSIVAPSESRPRLSDEQAQLAADHWHLALGIAEAFKKRYAGFSLVDFEGAAAIGICQAAMSWIPDNGTDFEVYMAFRVRGACLDAMRANRLSGYGRGVKFEGAPQVYSLDRPAEDRGRPVTHAAEIPSDEHATGWEAESEDEVRALSRRVPKGYGDVLRLLYLHPATVTMKEAGRQLGISESRVSQVHTDALRWLREHFRASAPSSGGPR